MVVEFDELRQRRSQSFRAGEHHEIPPSLERLVEPPQLAVGLRIARRAVNEANVRAFDSGDLRSRSVAYLPPSPTPISADGEQSIQ